MENLADYIFSSDLKSAQLLLDSGADINSKYGVLKTYPIYSALNSDNLDTLKFVIKNGADVNIEKGLPLSEAIDAAIDIMSQNNLNAPDEISMEMIKFLLEKGADPELEDDQNERPIDIISTYANKSEERLEILKSFFRPLFPYIDSLLEKK
jgi:ankyrin repeat protein